MGVFRYCKPLKGSRLYLGLYGTETKLRQTFSKVHTLFLLVPNVKQEEFSQFVFLTSSLFSMLFLHIVFTCFVIVASYQHFYAKHERMGNCM